MQEEPNLNFSEHGRFYIYGDIDETIPENIIAPLLAEIGHRSKQSDPEPIVVYITSDGGRLDYAFDLIATFDIAANLGIQITTVVTSKACSAASLIAVCGHKRVVSSRAFHLLHFAKSWDYSHNPEMSKRNHENLDFLNKEAIKIYKEKTKIKDIETKMLADNFMINGGKQLVKEGLADTMMLCSRKETE